MGNFGKSFAEAFAASNKIGESILKGAEKGSELQVKKNKIDKAIQSIDKFSSQFGDTVNPEERSLIDKAIQTTKDNVSSDIIDPKNWQENLSSNIKLLRESSGVLTKEQKLKDTQQFRLQVNQLDAMGGGIGPEFVKDYKDKIGFNMQPQLEAGRGIPYIDNEGKKGWRVLSQQEWRNKVKTGVFEPSEIEYLQKLSQEHLGWQNVLSKLEEAGITADDFKKSGKFEFETINTPIGPLSIPARYKLAAQYMENPKYSAASAMLEQAFQAFRSRVTGAQAGERELEYLRTIIPSLKDKPEVFFEITKSLMDNDKKAFQERLDIYDAAGRNTSEMRKLMKTDNTINSGIDINDESVIDSFLKSKGF